MKKIDRVLILSPHSDDGSLASGGTISRFIEEKIDVNYIIFHIDPEFKDECIIATECLGIPREKIKFYDHEIRRFLDTRQEILEEMLVLNSKIEPDLILVPTSHDIHQDHQTIHDESLRAFKTSCSIWGYEHPWNNFSMDTGVFVRLEERHIEQKIDSLSLYLSQNDRKYLDPTYIRSLANVRGTQINSQYAEVFENIRMMI